MSIFRSPSVSSARSHLPSYTAATRAPNLPTYSEHIEALSVPERAFIADQARLLNSSYHQPAEPKSSADVSSHDNESIARLQQTVNDEERNRPPLVPPRAPPRYDGWRFLLTIMLLIAAPVTITKINFIANGMPYSSNDNCSYRHQPTVKGAAAYFGIALCWIVAWVLLRVWKHWGCGRPYVQTHKWSIFWTLSIFTGYVFVVGHMWAKTVCA